MEAYQNKSGNSGVIEYEIGSDFIKVKFQRNNRVRVYLYNYQTPGAIHVETMKKKAIDGIGLATYISKHVGKNYFKEC